MKTVLVFGTFDLLHRGHLHFLREAEKLGVLYVAVACDCNVEKIKGSAPAQKQEQRKEAVANALPDAHVLLGDKNDYLAPIRLIQPDMIVLGYDQKMPPGLTMDTLPCPVKRLEAHQPEKYKSSLMKVSS